MQRGRGGYRHPPKILNQAAKDRFLGNKLGGAVFGATAETLKECTTGLVFGLPASNWNWVQHVREGMPIFLFNYTDKMMHGIFRAITPGTQNINPEGWTSISHTSITRYPAQVKVELFEKCRPIVDRDFKQAIQGAFFTDRQFNYQLTADEARKLCDMFSKSATKRLYQASAVKTSQPATQPPARQDSPAPPGPGSPTLALVGTHPSRRPSPSSSTGSSELHAARAKKNTAASSATPHSAVNQPGPAFRGQDTSTSSGQAPPGDLSHQLSQQADAGAKAALAVRQQRESAPPGFEKLKAAAAVTSKGAKPALLSIPSAWLKSRALQPTAAAFDPAAGARQQPQAEPSAASDAPSTSQQKQTADMQEPFRAQLGEEDQGAKRSRTDHHKHGHRFLREDTPEEAAPQLQQRPHQEALQVARPQPESSLATGEEEAHARQAGEEDEQMAGSQRASDLAQNEEDERRGSQQGSGADVEDVHMLGTTPPSSSGMQHLAAAAAASNHSSSQQGQHVYLVGGGTENRQSMWLNTVDIFMPSTLTCMSATSLPKECAYGSVATIGQRLFYVGGGNGIDWFSSMLRLALDDEDAQWEQMADMHIGRGSLCTAMQGFMLWAVGGRDSHTFHNSTECFHAGQNQWTWGPSTNTKRFAAASASLHNAIYITGGFDATMYTASAERMDPREGKWSPIADMVSSRGSHACAVLDDKLYAVGGWAALKPLREAEVYDARADRWRAIAPMNDTRAYFAGVACQGALYAIGGLSPENGNPNYKVTLEKYDPVRDTWEVLAPPANGLSSRAFMSACVV